MAVIAVVAAAYVGRVFAGRCDTIVARAAGSQHLRVIDSDRRSPDAGVMAVFTYVRCLYVVEGLTGCLRTVVAADAIAGHACVIEIGWPPANRRVTVFAVVAT